MSAFNHPWLLAGGMLLVLAGVLLWRWASRHDLKGLAVDAAWQVAKNRGNLASAADSELGQRLKDIAGDGSNVSRAAKVAGHAARHAAAQVANITGLVAMAIGAALVGLAFWLG